MPTFSLFVPLLLLLITAIFAAPQQYVTSAITLAPSEPTVPPAVPKAAGVSPYHVATYRDTDIDTCQVYICSDDNFGGKCFHYFSLVGTSPHSCVQLDGTVTSIGPDPGVICWFFTHVILGKISFFTIANTDIAMTFATRLEVVRGTFLN
jgi:hypothetical protein